MADLFNITHDDGTLDEYTTTVTDGGDLSVGTPGLATTIARMEAFIDDTTGIYGEVDQVCSTNEFRIRFYLDPNGLTMGSGDLFVIQRGVNGGAPWDVYYIYLGYDGDDYWIRVNVTDDEDSWNMVLGDYVISDAEHYIEFHLERESGADQNDGVMTVWIDGDQKGTRADVDNFALWDPRYWRLGAVAGIDWPTTNGTFYLDQMKANDDGSEIGPAVISRDTYWGHVTGVVEDNVRTFVNNWTGSAAIVGSGDGEQVCISAGENMFSEIVNTGLYTVTLVQNIYDGTGDDVTLAYRHSGTVAGCQAASWVPYSTPFTSLGFVQVRTTPS